MRFSWMATVPLLLLSAACSQVKSFCDAAPCPSLSASGEVQPLPHFVDSGRLVRPGERRVLEVQVDLRGLPPGTLLTWVRPSGTTLPDGVLLEVPGVYRIETAQMTFQGDTQLILTVDPQTPAGLLGSPVPVLALQKAASSSRTYGPLPLDFRVVR